MPKKCENWLTVDEIIAKISRLKPYFHHGCALRRVALRGERNTRRDADSVSISLATQRNAQP